MIILNKLKGCLLILLALVISTSLSTIPSSASSHINKIKKSIKLVKLQRAEKNIITPIPLSSLLAIAVIPQQQTITHSVTLKSDPKPTATPTPAPTSQPVVQQAIQVASVASGGVETIVNQAASNSGWGSSEIAAFDWIIEHESGFRVNATNPTSSAYGICQSLPGNKMASAGADWQTNPRTQAIWCIGYIKSSYGDALNAKSFWLIHRWF